MKARAPRLFEVKENMEILKKQLATWEPFKGGLRETFRQAEGARVL